MKSIFKTSEIKKKYDILEILGSGTFSEVRLGINKETGQHVAIKTVEPKDKDEELMAKLEIELLTELSHPYILHSIEVFEIPGKMLKGKKYQIVTEVLNGGELLDRILQKTYLLESEARPIMKMLFEVITFIHDKGVVHRDLKPGNIMFADETENSPIKLIDFGCSAKIDPNVPMTAVLGTPVFVAPEILRKLERGYGKEVDIWSCGVIMYVMLCGFPPFHGDDDEKLFNHIKSGKFEFTSPYWDNISQEAKDLVTQCLIVDPSQRISAAQAMKHTWFGKTKNVMEDYRVQLKGLNSFMTRRKFKRLVNCVVITNRFQSLLNN
eukprot:c19464_g2_i1.p1 GENE.c19464_g2_i1~~c19464_g2_i1.p1  ORF type:complete len:323 (+),score=114.45 c19464_g2_i1:14-982(+)